jgi:hypothetical protein
MRTSSGIPPKKEVLDLVKSKIQRDQQIAKLMDDQQRLLGWIKRLDNYKASAVLREWGVPTSMIKDLVDREKWDTSYRGRPASLDEIVDGYKTTHVLERLGILR